MTRTCEHPGCTTPLRKSRPPQDVYCSAHEQPAVEVVEQPVGYEARRERIVELIEARGQRSSAEFSRILEVSLVVVAEDLRALRAQRRIECLCRGNQTTPTVYRVVPSADELDELMGSAA